MVRARTAKLLVALALAAGLIWAIDTWLGWARLLRPWQRLDPLTLAAALGLALGSHALRALRFQRYFVQTRGVGFHHALQLVLRHNLLNNLLPMRSGEASFPLLARRAYGIPLGKGVGGLLVFRLLDLHTIAWLGAAALYPSTGRSGWLLVAVALLPLPLLGPALARRGASLQPRLPGRLGETMGRVMTGLPRSSRSLGEVWCWTVAVWAGKLTAFAWLLTRFGELDFGRAWLGATAGDLTSVLPIHGWAGAGTYEAGVVAALVPLGVGAETAFAMAVNLHLFILGTTLTGGMVALVLPSRRHPSTEAAPDK